VLLREAGYGATTYKPKAECEYLELDHARETLGKHGRFKLPVRGVNPQ